MNAISELLVTGIYCVLLGCITLFKTRSWIKEMDGRSTHDPWCLQSKCVCVGGVDIVCMYHMSVKWNDQETFAFLNLSPRLGPGTLCFRAVKFVPGHTSLQATKYKETI